MKTSLSMLSLALTMLMLAACAATPTASVDRTHIDTWADGLPFG
jgi:uncharacterized lipoprotein YajG